MAVESVDMNLNVPAGRESQGYVLSCSVKKREDEVTHRNQISSCPVCSGTMRREVRL